MRAGTLGAVTAAAHRRNPPPPSYTTGAVHFDGAASLSGAIDIPDTPLASISVWAKVSPAIMSTSFLVDATNYNFNIDMFFTNPPGTTAVHGLKWLVGDATFTNWLEGDPDIHVVLANDTWIWFSGMVNTNFALGSRLFGTFADTVDVSSHSQDGDGDAFSMHFSGLTFGFPDSDDAPYYIGDIADLWFAPGQYVDFSDPAVQAKFRDPLTGKPVDLGADGSTPTGTAPAIFFRRAPSGAASTFAANLGTAGSFTIGGTLTNASSSPSD